MRKPGTSWTKQVTDGLKLGDRRRNARVDALLQALTECPGESLAQAAEDGAEQERFYRHARCEAVKVDALVDGLCAGTAACVAEAIEEGDVVLLIGDTTSLSYRHAVAEYAGPTGADLSAKARGWEVHTMLAVSARTKEVWGPVETILWTRDPETHGQRRERNERDYRDKESFKWEAAANSARERMHRVGLGGRSIHITDRESDVYEYLVHQLGEGQRFIARASWNRRVAGEVARVFEALAAQPVRAEYCLEIPQKGGRPARRAHLQLRSARVTLRPPRDVESMQPQVEINAVELFEPCPPVGVEPVRWVLFTNEPIDSVEDCYAVVENYGCRWRIEEYHKFLKSQGMDVERLLMQEPENLLRVAVPMMHAAARLMNLRDSLLEPVSRLTRMAPLAETSHPPVPAPAVPHTALLARGEHPCTDVLTASEWQCLWVAVAKSRPPEEVPSRRWAALSVARLGGFKDTKRTGRPGYSAFVHGWERLMDRVAMLGELHLMNAIPRPEGRR